MSARDFAGAGRRTFRAGGGDAFDQGKTQLGEELTALALRYLDEADTMERAYPQ